jgi:hypothetical protein
MRRGVFPTGSPTPRPRHGMTLRPRLRPLNTRLVWQHLASSATSGPCPRRVPPAARTGFPHSGAFTQAPLTLNGRGRPARNVGGSVTLCRSLVTPKPMHRTMKSNNRPKETACFPAHHCENSTNLDARTDPVAVEGQRTNLMQQPCLPCPHLVQRS